MLRRHLLATAAASFAAPAIVSRASLGQNLRKVKMGSAFTTTTNAAFLMPEDAEGRGHRPRAGHVPLAGPAHAGGRLGRRRYRQRRPVGHHAARDQGLPDADPGQRLRRRLDGAGPALDRRLEGSRRQEDRRPERLDRPGLAQLEAQAGRRVRQGRDGLHGQPGPAGAADARRRGRDLRVRALRSAGRAERLGQEALGARTTPPWARPTWASSPPRSS